MSMLTVCPVCQRLVRIRKDGCLSKHPVKVLGICPGSGTKAEGETHHNIPQPE